MAKAKRPLSGRKINIRLTKEIDHDIGAYCREKDIESESELIRQAILRYINRDYQETTMELQGLRDTQAQLTELRDMIDILFRYIRLMHINILAYHPEIDQAVADPAFKSAMDRHGDFFKSFQDSLRNDPAFFERLLHTYFSGDRDK
jgi:Arc/MetJ-type ribon-helix-helix transcriptional regulator